MGNVSTQFVAVLHVENRLIYLVSGSPNATLPECAALCNKGHNVTLGVVRTKEILSS